MVSLNFNTIIPIINKVYGDSEDKLNLVYLESDLEELSVGKLSSSLLPGAFKNTSVRQSPSSVFFCLL